MPRTYDAKVQGKDGTYVDVQVSSTAISFGQNNIKILAQVLDRTDAETNRRALELFEKQHKVIVETMNEGLGVIDDRGTISFANRALCELTGYQENKIIGMAIGDLLHGLAIDNVAEKVSQRRFGMKDRYEVSLIHRSKHKIPVMIAASPFYDSSQTYSGSIAVFTDLSQVYEERRKLQKINQRALFYMDLLQHDVRNKLQEIQGFTELAINQIDNNARAHSLNYALTAISQCTDLISKTTVLEKLMEMPLTGVLLSETLLTALKYFNNIEKIANLKITGPLIEANELLEQMFILLIDNICKRNPSEKKRLWVNIAEKGSYHEVLLYDNSPAFPESEIDNLFDPLKRIGGMELLVIQQIIERFNGKISVTNNTMGTGSIVTEFRIQFPKIE
jgi:PAS domain S-box-containing protein